MKAIVFFVLLAMLISAEGIGGAMAGMLLGLGIDIPVTLIVGGSFAEIFTGWGLIDDVIMAMLRLGWGVADKFLLSVLIANSTHVAEEAYEQWDHSDEQNRRYSDYLARKYPGQTFVYGDVTHRDLFELGLSGGVLLYRRVPRSVWQEGLEYMGDIVL